MDVICSPSVCISCPMVNPSPGRMSLIEVAEPNRQHAHVVREDAGRSGQRLHHGQRKYTLGLS